MQGQRQNLAARLIAAAGEYEFVTDLPKIIQRIKFYPNEEIASPTAERVTIQAEQELLYSGQSVPICGVAIKTDDGHTTGQPRSAWVLQFDRPLEFSKDFPIRVTLAGSEAWWVILEGA